MQSDILISRYVRPSILIWLTLLFSVIIIIDGNYFNINIKDSWTSVLESIMMVAYGSYFVGKSYEHGKRIGEKNDTNNTN